jgi:pyruvate kinase
MTKHPLLYSQDSSSIVRTKIVCTLGPASCSEGIIRDMIVNGMAVARINMAHCDHEFVAKAMNMVRKICNEIDAEVYVAVWLDLNGPKVLGKLKIGSNRCDAG